MRLCAANALVLLCAAACGRTEIYRAAPAPAVEVPPPFDAGCASDDNCFDANLCTLDICAADGSCQHPPADEMCHDDDWCRVSVRCDTLIGCVSDPRDCSDGIACHVGSCDAAAHACVIDFDSTRCDAGFTCGPQGCTGCAGDAGCDDGIACTLDTCLADGRCTHAVDDSQCSAGLHCGPTGCGAWAYAVTPDGLYDIEVHTGLVRQIGPTATFLTDVAFGSDGRLIGCAGNQFMSLDRVTADETPFGLQGNDLNALDFGPDGTLYGAGLQLAFAIDFDAGVERPIAILPTAMISSGDIAFVDGQMLISTSSASMATNALVRLDPADGGAQIIADIGFGCVFGLAAFGPALYGFDCSGNVISISLDGGSSTVAFQTSLSFLGASSR